MRTSERSIERRVCRCEGVFFMRGSIFHARVELATDMSVQSRPRQKTPGVAVVCLSVRLPGKKKLQSYVGFVRQRLVKKDPFPVACHVLRERCEPTELDRYPGRKTGTRPVNASVPAPRAAAF